MGLRAGDARRRRRLDRTAAVRAMPDVVDADARVVLIPISRLGPAALQAVRYAPLVPARARIAVHVSVDAAATHRLALDWMDTGLGRELHLDIVDPVGTIAETLAVAAADRLNEGAKHVVVVTTRHDAPRRWYTARGEQAVMAIYAELSRVYGATTVVLDVPLPSRRLQRGGLSPSSEQSR
jgi:hypothetical protein